MQTATGYKVDWMIRGQLPDVMDICWRNGQAWTEQDFLTCLAARNCIGMVALHGKQVAGYMIYELHKDKIGLLAIEASPDHPTANVDLMDRLKSKLHSRRRTRIVYDVPDDELPTHLFLRSQGFRATKTIGEMYRFKFCIDS